MFRILVQLLSPYRRRVFIAAIALVIAAGTRLAVGQGLRAVIDKGFSAGDPAWLDRTLASMGGLIVLLAGATYLRFYNVSWLGERVTADIRRRVFDHLLTLPPAWFEAGRTGEVISRLTADTTQLAREGLTEKALAMSATSRMVLPWHAAMITAKARVSRIEGQLPARIGESSIKGKVAPQRREMFRTWSSLKASYPRCPPS